MLTGFKRWIDQKFVYKPRHCQKCCLLAYPAERNIVFCRHLHHHDAGQQAIEINGDFVINELAALTTKVLGLQQFFDKLVELFFLPAKMVEFPQLSYRISGFVSQSGDKQR